MSDPCSLLTIGGRCASVSRKSGLLSKPRDSVSWQVSRVRRGKARGWKCWSQEWNRGRPGVLRQPSWTWPESRWFPAGRPAPGPPARRAPPGTGRGLPAGPTRGGIRRIQPLRCPPQTGPGPLPKKRPGQPTPRVPFCRGAGVWVGSCVAASCQACRNGSRSVMHSLVRSASRWMFAPIIACMA